MTLTHVRAYQRAAARKVDEKQRPMIMLLNDLSAKYIRNEITDYEDGVRRTLQWVLLTDHRSPIDGANG